MRFAIVATVSVLALAFSLSAHAAGYVCSSVDRDTEIVVKMESAQSGQATSVVYSDPTLSKRSQAIAVFTVADGSLESSRFANGVRFVGTFDQPVEHGGKRLGGTKIGLLTSVTLEIQTITARKKVETFEEGGMSAAEVTYVKTDGKVLKQDFDCALFLGESAPILDFDQL